MMWLFKVLLLAPFIALAHANTVCHAKDVLFGSAGNTKLSLTCPSDEGTRNAVYLLYDVNPPEGFNLRRDVYIRLAVFVRRLRKTSERFANIRLVLPPWRRLYHWKSSHLQQDGLLWRQFFDVESFRRYAPVLDFSEFLEEIRQFNLQEAPYVSVHKTLQLLHFEDMFENGVFRDRYEFMRECPRERHTGGHLLQQSELLENEFTCVRFQGSATLLERVLRQTLRELQPPLKSGEPAVIVLLNAEHVLHDNWGDREFWRARRSMRFAEPLVQLADQYRKANFDASNESDMVQRPPMWEFERPYRAAIGGAYLCAHLRRGDFVHGRERTTPTLKSAALQLKQHLQTLNLTAVFLATDANAFELKNLKAYLQRARLFRFGCETLTQKQLIKDGGIAIVDQLVCANARYFVGTYESTFTYRIYEEREILGFPKASTFNTFCRSETFENCSHNSVWPIVY